MKHRFLTFTLILSMLCMGRSAFSQGVIEWQRLLGGSSEEKTSRIIQTADSGYITIGYSLSSDGDAIGNHGVHDVFVVKLSKYGNIEWSHSYGGSDVELGTAITQTSDGNYVFCAMSKSSDGDVLLNKGNEDFWIVKIDNLGNMLWQKTYGGTYADFPLNIIETSNNMIIVNGYTVSNDLDVSGNHGGNDVWVVKLNALGNLVWQKTYGGTGTEISSQLVETADLGYLFTSYTTSNDFDVTGNHGSADIWNVKLDSAGALVWQKTYGGTTDENAFAIKKTNDNNYVIAGWTASNDGDVSGNHGGLADEWVIKIDNSGALIWQQCIGGSLEDRAYDIVQKSDSTFILVGYTNSFATRGSFDAWICKLAKDGDLMYRKNIGGTYIDVTNAITATNDNKFVLCSYTNSIDGDISGGYGDYDFWVCKINDPVRTVSGNIFADVNANCSLDTNYIGLHNIILRDAITGAYTISDGDGNYFFPTYTNAAKLYIANLDTIFSLSCLTGDTIEVIADTSSIFDVVSLDFPITSDKFCHSMFIDISTSFFRTCRMGTVYLAYENTGAIQAHSAFIMVEIDTSIIDSIYSTYPYIQMGDSLRFDLGTIDAHAHGTLSFEGRTKCTAIGHSSNCVRAYVYPASDCVVPNVAYDSTDLEVTTVCSGDTVKVQIRNRSSHNMSDRASIRAYEDEIIQRVDSFIILAGGTVNFDYYTAIDRTATMIINQSPYHPRNPQLIRFDELCALTTPILGHSMVNEFSRYDNAADYEEYCGIIGNSWDPNIKTVTPSGFTDEHYTDSNQVLEYRIDFQNTGSDTAFKVVIIDTLDLNLDVNTFQPLLGSHSYTPVLEGNHTIKFVFDPIILPDSTHSEPASHGFVTFKIQPKHHTTRGTVINNFGDIYFDYNAPVRTNKVFNTIYDTLLIHVGIDAIQITSEAPLLVFPNPAVQRFFIKLDKDLNNAQLVLTDMNGKELFEMNQLNGRLQEIQLPQLGGGMYFIQLYEKNKLIGRNKLIIK